MTCMTTISVIYKWSSYNVDRHEEDKSALFVLMDYINKYNLLLSRRFHKICEFFFFLE